LGCCEFSIRGKSYSLNNWKEEEGKKQKKSRFQKGNGFCGYDDPLPVQKKRRKQIKR
jgi:hypothetical protein